MNNTQEKNVFSRIGLAYLLGALAYYCLVSIGSALISRINPGILVGNASLLFSYAVLLLLGYPLMYLIVKAIPVTEIPKKKLGFGMAVVAWFCAYFLMVVCNLLGLVINAQLGKITGQGLQNPITSVIGDLDLWVQLLIVVVCAPIAEELVFRKMLVDRVYKYGELLAALTSGLMFGLFHGNFQQFVYAFGLGVFFAFIYIRTGKIIYTIVFHMIINFMGTMPMNLFMKGIDIQKVQQYIFTGQIDEYMAYVQEHMTQFAMIGLYGMMMIIVLIVGLVLVIVFAKKFKFQSHEGDLSAKQAWSSLFGNVGMILFAIWWIFNIVLAQFGTSFSDLIYKLFV